MELKIALANGTREIFLLLPIHHFVSLNSQSDIVIIVVEVVDGFRFRRLQSRRHPAKVILDFLQSFALRFRKVEVEEDGS